MTRPPLTRALAAYVSEFPEGAVGKPAAVEVSRAVLDLFGVTVAGAADPAGRLALQYARAEAGSGPAAVLGAGVRITPSLAALVNGTAGHALDYDDIGLQAGHVSTAMIPGALAVAELASSTGAEFVEALALGYEITNRLTRLFPDNLSGPYRHGYHKPSVYAVFGGVAASARLLRLDASQTAHALGIAASQTGGLKVNFGTMTKPLHAGIACRTAVEAALLARAGFTASPEALEGRFGWYDVICRGEGDLAAAMDSLGAPFAVEEGMIYKAYPCCGANHHTIDGLLYLIREHDLAADDIAQVEVAVHAPYLNDVLIYPWPRSGLEGKFSLPYNIAAAVVDGAVTVGTFEDDQVARLAQVRDRIRVLPDESLPADRARISLQLADGRHIDHEHTVLRGTLEAPFDWNELAAKFTANVTLRLPAAAAAEAASRIETLSEQESLHAITELLKG